MFLCLISCLMYNATFFYLAASPSSRKTFNKLTDWVEISFFFHYLPFVFACNYLQDDVVFSFSAQFRLVDNSVWTNSERVAIVTFYDTGWWRWIGLKMRVVCVCWCVCPWVRARVLFVWLVSFAFHWFCKSIQVFAELIFLIKTILLWPTMPIRHCWI